MPNAAKPRRRLPAAFLVVACAVILALFMAWLIGVRFSSGDVYPAYSSLRADPVGTKALHDALRETPGLTVVRNREPWEFFEPPPSSTILMLGAPPDKLSDDGHESLQKWLEAGHRIVVTLRTARGYDNYRSDKKRKTSLSDDPENEEIDENGETENEADNEKENDAPDSPDEEEEVREVLEELLEESSSPVFSGLTTRYAVWLKEGGTLDTKEGIPSAPWHGSHILEIDEGSDWKILATVEDRVVMAERKIGDKGGTLVVFTDSYPLSNEGLWREAHTSFVLFLLGDNPHIVFDEVHLGTQDRPGIMTLIRRLRLHGLVCGGLLVFALLIWQGLLPLVPVSRDRDMGIDQQGSVSGRDAVEGLVAILRRGIPSKDLLTHCLARWQKKPPEGPRPTADALKDAEKFASAARPGHLAEAYLRIRELLNTRK